MQLISDEMRSERDLNKRIKRTRAENREKEAKLAESRSDASRRRLNIVVLVIILTGVALGVIGFGGLLSNWLESL